MRLVTIIIPTINNLEYIVPCIKSIARSTIGIFRFLIINQGRKEIDNYIVFDGGMELRSSKILHVDKALGWAGAINYGLNNLPKKVPLPDDYNALPARNNPYKRIIDDYIMFLNDDTFILPGDFGWLTDLTNVLECDPKVGAVAPASNFVSGWQNMRNVQCPLLVETKYLIGFCLLTRRSLIEKIGGLDESLPGGDDLDFSIRIRDAGYKLVARRNTFVYHYGQISGKKAFGDDWDSQRHQDATKMALIKKHGFRKTHECYTNECVNYESLMHEYGKNHCLQRIVKGKGLDIGCGQNKEPGTIGIDSEVDGHKTQADIIGPGDDLSFDNKSQDYIISRHSIEHFFNPIKTLREWNRVLKTGGRLGITTPDGTRWQSIECDGDHKHQFDRSSIKDLLEVTGFETEELDCCSNQLDFYVICRKVTNATKIYN